ncbi:MAG: LemA family protein [Neisseriaceae bacterium]|nr:LemA family protein [Neisseriaceae bacterium]
MLSAVITLIVLVAVAAWLITIYNRLVLLKNRFQNAFSQIDVQLKRRHDLIPNLVETAKGYLAHERETMQAVIEARNAAVKGLADLKGSLNNPDLMQAFTTAEQNLQSALGRFNMVVENYPDLKASPNMMQLSEEISSTENRIAFARQHYNDSVTEYNVFRQYFPNNIVAGAFGHAKDATLLEFDDKPQIMVAPEVKFSA